MRFIFSSEQEAWRQEVISFIEEELDVRLQAGADAFGSCYEAAIEFRKKLGQKKWIGIGWPKEYGGIGASAVMQCIFHDEMIYHHAPLDAQAYHLGPVLIKYGSEYLKKKFIAGTASQEITWCQGFSEPNAGSDLANLGTYAIASGDDYVINGSKIWTSMAHKADWIHILVRTDTNAPKHKGISYFIVDMKHPGITIAPLVDMSNDHHFNQVFFENVRVPKINMIGEKNMGWYVATTTLDHERSGIQYIARSRRILDDILKTMHSLEAVRGIRRDAIAIHKVADMRIQLSVSRKLSYRVAWLQDQGFEHNREASIAKVFATELLQRVGRVGIEITGFYGHLLADDRRAPNSGLIPYISLRSVSGTIAAGTSEINRNIIATRGLGLPKG